MKTTSSAPSNRRLLAKRSNRPNSYRRAPCSVNTERFLEPTSITMSKLFSYIVILSYIAAGLPAAAQAPGEKPLMVEDVFKNVQVLKGLPVNQFMETMG